MRTTPVPTLLHGFSFALTGIMAYVAWDAIMSPLHKSPEARVDAVRTKLYPEIRFASVGCVLC
jgi:hypothetical protein